MMKRKGDPAPDFTIRLPDGELTSLFALLRTHHLVLSFYPRDFSFGCTRQMCAYRDRIDEFSALGARVIGVSRDTHATHRLFAAAHRLPFPLVEDAEGRIARAYGVEPGGKAVELRARVTFVIARGRLIHGVIRHNLRFKKHVEDALRDLQTMEQGGA